MGRPAPLHRTFVRPVLTVAGRLRALTQGNEADRHGRDIGTLINDDITIDDAALRQISHSREKVKAFTSLWVPELLGAPARAHNEVAALLNDMTQAAPPRIAPIAYDQVARFDRKAFKLLPTALVSQLEIRKADLGWVVAGVQPP